MWYHTSHCSQNQYNLTKLLWYSNKNTSIHAVNIHYSSSLSVSPVRASSACWAFSRIVAVIPEVASIEVRIPPARFLHKIKLATRKVREDQRTLIFWRGCSGFLLWPVHWAWSILRHVGHASRSILCLSSREMFPWLSHQWCIRQ